MAIYVSSPRRHLHSPRPSGVPFLHWSQTISDIFSCVTSGQQSQTKLVLWSHLCPGISPNLLQSPPCSFRQREENGGVGLRIASPRKKLQDTWALGSYGQVLCPPEGFCMAPCSRSVVPGRPSPPTSRRGLLCCFPNLALWDVNPSAFSALSMQTQEQGA